MAKAHTVAGVQPHSERERGTAQQNAMRLTTGQALARFLTAQWSERDGVRRRVIAGVFGIYGHGNVPGLGEALDAGDVDLRFHQAKNEQSMVHAAIGYAKASDGLSTFACTSSIGPGSTNLVTGAATATINRIPVLLLPADTFANRKQGNVLQQLEHPVSADFSVNETLRPVSRFFDRISRPEQLLSALPQAIRVLLDPAETGAVTISLHQDVLGEAYDFPPSFFEPRVWTVARRPPAPEEIETAVAILASSHRPLIVAGGGVRYSGAIDELLGLSARLGVPIAETYAGKGVASAAELRLDGVGVLGTSAANAIAREADVVLCVGTRLSDFITASRSLFEEPGVRFIGVNIDAADAHKLGATPIVADAKLALKELTRSLDAVGWSTSREYRERVRHLRGEWQERQAADLAPREGEAVGQGEFLVALSRLLGPSDVVVAASGTPLVDTYRILDCSSGATAYLEFGYSCMGHEIPCGLGVRLARLNRGDVFVIIGDGTYLMGGASELVTAIQENAKIIVIISDNHGHQSIRALAARTTGSPAGTEFRRRTKEGLLVGDIIPIDYATNARSLGCAAFDVHSVEEFEEAVSTARAEERPCVVVLHVEPQRATAGDLCWWDVGFAQETSSDEVRRNADAHAEDGKRQRLYY